MKLNVLILLISFSFVLNAQTTSVPLKEINADLPDETEETDLLDKGQLQVETAFLYNHFFSDASPKIVQSLIRYGLFNYLEARLLIEDGYARDKYLEETVQSTAPLALSTKISLLKDHSILPNITLVGYLKLPFTSRTGEQLPYWAPNVSLAFQHKFGDKWKLEYNVGGQQEVYSTDWVEFFNASIHYKVADRLELFTEYYGQYQTSEDPQHNVGFGAFYQINNYLGFYAVSGSTIQYKPHNYFVSGGIVVRLLE